MRKKRGGSYYVNRHSCYKLSYHMVLVTKYRRPVLIGAVKDRVYDIIRDTVETRGYELTAINGEADHVHILFDAPPAMAPAEFANAVKTRTARLTRKEFPDEIRKFYWKPLFWTDSYFVATVGKNTEAVVREYIRNQ